MKSTEKTLYDSFTWDDTKAATEQRLHEARSLIREAITSAREEAVAEFAVAAAALSRARAVSIALGINGERIDELITAIVNLSNEVESGGATCSTVN